MRQLDKLFDKDCLLYESAVQSHVRLTFIRTYQTCLIRATERETVRTDSCQTVA